MKLMLKKKEAQANKNEDCRASSINLWVTTLAYYKCITLIVCKFIIIGSFFIETVLIFVQPALQVRFLVSIHACPF